MLTSNARIICASNCSLRERVRQGKFREDLYQRLNGLTLLIPPLRGRLQELPGIDRCGVESGWIKRRQKHHGNSSRSDGEVASRWVARKPSRIEPHRASHDAVVQWFVNSARACRFSSRSGVRSECV